MNKQTVYDEITAKIIGQLERGVMPWLTPWSDKVAAEISGMLDSVPINRVSGKAYSGVNTLLLWIECVNRQWPQPWQFVTYKQARELGGHVREGEKATMVVYVGEAPNKDYVAPAPGEMSSQDPTYKFLKKYWVFHLSQCEGITPRKVNSDRRALTDTEFNAFVASTGAHVRVGGTHAMYSPLLDFITMPPLGAFVASTGEVDGPQHYKATLCHELVHWTGHKKRLAREKTLYGFEELVAEIGSAFLCAELGVKGELRHAEYVATWVKRLREDNRAIVRAASQASKAAEYLIALRAKPIAKDHALVPVAA